MFARFILTMALLLASVVLTTSASRADYIPPDQVAVKTDFYQLSPTSFQEGVYYFDVSWQSIPVGRAKVEVNSQQIDFEPFLRVKATVQTSSFIDLFYRLRHSSESTFHSNTLRPQHFYSWQKENSREKYREVLFGSKGDIRAVGTNNGVVSDALEFHSDNLTLDPITAAFVARSIPLAEGKSIRLDVFNGKHRYLITFLVEGREELVLQGKHYDTFRVKPAVQKLTDSEGETRLQSATLWISASPDHEVLKLESKVWAGKINAKMVKFSPKSGSFAGQLRARLSSDPDLSAPQSESSSR